MRVIVAFVVGLVLLSALPGDAGANDPAEGLERLPQAFFPTGTEDYEANVAAWVGSYHADTGNPNVPDETMRTIEFFAQYSAPIASQEERVGPLDTFLPYGVHVGYMYFECGLSTGLCFVDDWWGNVNTGPCTGYYLHEAYEQINTEMTMAEWRGGYVNTYTEGHFLVHFASYVDSAILNGYMCQGQIGNRIVAVFSGWGVFDHHIMVDPLPPPWDVVPVRVGPPPPPYDDLGPPICPDWTLCWGPEDLVPQPLNTSLRPAVR